MPTALGHMPQALLLIHDGNDRDLVLGRGVQLEHAVSDAGVAGDHQRRRAFVGRLRTDAQLHRGARADHHRQVRTDGRVLIRAVHFLPWPIGAQPAGSAIADGPAAPTGHRLLRIDAALVQKIVHFLANHGVMQRVGGLAVLHAQVVFIQQSFLVLLPRRMPARPPTCRASSAADHSRGPSRNAPSSATIPKSSGQLRPRSSAVGFTRIALASGLNRHPRFGSACCTGRRKPPGPRS